jgi:hypothetical protein
MHLCSHSWLDNVSGFIFVNYDLSLVEYGGPVVHTVSCAGVVLREVGVGFVIIKSLKIFILYVL